MFRKNFRPAPRLAACALILWLLVPAATSVSGGLSTTVTTVTAQRRGRVGPSSAAAAPVAARAPRARLILLIVVDQFRYDFLERFDDLFVAGGLRRLQRDGGSWTRADYEHIPTETAPGHATLMTGTWPAENGIIGNEWFDRETGRRVSNVTDAATRLLGGGATEEASSPRRLLASTLGDELRLATLGRSKAIGISVKDRGAILPVGRHATAAYWYSSQTGHMVSSSYYFNQLPDWVARFNEARMADKFFGARWERLLAESEYVRRAGADAPPWETVGSGGGARQAITFPHVIAGRGAAPGREFYNELNFSPFSNDLLLAFAEQAIVNEALGMDEDPDVLSVSFSAHDYVGHRFGPYSHEVMDITLRLDRQIAALLDKVDARVGLNRTLVVFTADHGVAPVPEHAAALNLPGGRIKSSDVLGAIRNAVKARYGRPGDAKDATADYIQTFQNGSVYFNSVALKRDRVDRTEIERVAGEAAMTVPGVARYFTRTQLEGGAIPPSDPTARRVLHGFHPQRSGDVTLVYGAFKYPSESTSGTGHGSPYSYDTHVPLIIMGRGIAPGRYPHPAAPSDIAPTLSVLLGVQAPSNATGRVLVEAVTR